MKQHVSFKEIERREGITLFKITAGSYRNWLFASSHVIVGESGTVLLDRSGPEIWVSRKNGGDEPVSSSYPLYRPNERALITGFEKSARANSAVFS